jgi:hypothetical protein
VFFLVFDNANRESFQELPQYLRLIDDYSSNERILFLIANKSDLPRQVSSEEVSNFGKSNGFENYGEFSFKAATNVELLEKFVSRAMEWSKENLWEKEEKSIRLKEKKPETSSCCAGSMFSNLALELIEKARKEPRKPVIIENEFLLSLIDSSLSSTDEKKEDKLVVPTIIVDDFFYYMTCSYSRVQVILTREMLRLDHDCSQFIRDVMNAKDLSVTYLVQEKKSLEVLPSAFRIVVKFWKTGVEIKIISFDISGVLSLFSMPVEDLKQVQKQAQEVKRTSEPDSKANAIEELKKLVQLQGEKLDVLINLAAVSDL